MFRLDIYTWPAGCGIDPEIERTKHETPQDAVNYLEVFPEAFSYAVLLIVEHGGSTKPCDWNGNLPKPYKKWPHKYGSNHKTFHPDLQRLKIDWEFLLNETNIRRANGGPGTIEIARELMKERHPKVCGWAETIANAAYDYKITGEYPKFAL